MHMVDEVGDEYDEEDDDDDELQDSLSFLGSLGGDGNRTSGSARAGSLSLPGSAPSSASATVTSFRVRSESLGFNGSSIGVGARSGMTATSKSMRMKGGITKSKTLPLPNTVRRATSSLGLNSFVASQNIAGGPGASKKDVLGYFDLKPVPIPVPMAQSVSGGLREEGAGTPRGVEAIQE